jgi:hypothetical protein
VAAVETQETVGSREKGPHVHLLLILEGSQKLNHRHCHHIHHHHLVVVAAAAAAFASAVPLTILGPWSLRA